MDKFTIEEANKDDLLKILEVQRATWLDTYVNKEYDINRKDIDLHTKITTERIEKQSKYFDKPGTKFFIAKVKNKIIGYSSPWIEEDKNMLGAIYILPKFQRQGIGKVLLDKVIDHYKGKDIYLTCATYNEKALNFYKKYGFIENRRGLTHKLKTGKEMPVVEMVRKYN